jgi:tetratricopeptide (TPR) repeat protein
MQDDDRAVALNPGSAEYHNARCMARAILDKDLNLALGDCNKALQIKPNEPFTFDSREFVYFRMGNYAASIADGDAALAINAKIPSTLYIRGLAKLKSGDAAGGKADIAAALALDAKVADTYAGYGVKP